MTGDPTLPPSSGDNGKARQKVILKTNLRIVGGILMLSGPVMGFDMWGAATFIGVADGLTERIFGGILFCMGAVDYFALPGIFDRID